VDGFPGRYRRSQRIQQCTTGVSADNNLSIVMKHLFRDIVSSEPFAALFQGYTFHHSWAPSLFYRFGKVKNKSQCIFSSHFTWSAYLCILELKLRNK
jgi:hypothetical protein